MENKIREIIDTLNAASNAYYNGESEIMSNYEWDSLFDTLINLENETGIIFPDSPTQKVSEDDTPGNKVKHRFPALSLAKTKDINDIIKWSNNLPVWVSWKLDGLTLVATYTSDGKTAKLTTLATRGNGTAGTDVTHFAKYISGLPLSINYPHDIIVRGESLISYEDFNIVNSSVGNIYANPRNLASGSMTLLDEVEFSKRRIHFVAFTLVHTDENIKSWGDRMNLLQSLNFEVVDRIECINNEDIKQAIESFSAISSSNKCVYPVDGLVVVYDDTIYAEGGSVTGHHATRGGIAFKWADESVETTLDHIEWSCSTNSITPVAVFNPVHILGSTVQRASLHNISECKRLGIKGKGTKIEVIKANMIIPQVVNVITAEGEFKIPDICPVCGSPTRINISDSGTETLICENESCTAKNISKLTRFVSKNAMNIDGLSIATLNTFIKNGFIDTMESIYNLPNFYNEISSLPGFGKKSADNIMKELEKSRSVTADRFLYSLSIPMCGRDVSKKLMTSFTLTEFKNIVFSNMISKISSIEGMGTEKTTALFDWFKNKDNIKTFETLITVLNISDIKSTANNIGACSGNTFVITGDVYKFKNREEIKSKIEELGGKVSGSVSSKTSYLINNNIESTSGKNKKAKELGIPIISEEEFITKFMA